MACPMGSRNEFRIASTERCRIAEHKRQDMQCERFMARIEHGSEASHAIGNKLPSKPSTKRIGFKHYYPQAMISEPDKANPQNKREAAGVAG